MHYSKIINTHFSADLGYGNEESRSMSPTPSPVMKNTPDSCSTLMLWANHLKETSNKIDAGIMPPPATTLPLNIRRSSLSGLLSCGVAEQSSPPILKSEILDENSQNSILSTGAESMNHDSIDYVNDNSMDASNPGTLMSATPMDMISNTFAPVQPMLNMPTTSPINLVDLRVKQEEEMAAQIQDLVHPSLSEPAKLMPGVHANDASFLTTFGQPKIVDMKVNEVQMFDAPTTTNVLLGNRFNGLNHVVVPTLATDSHMQSTMDAQPTVFAPPLMTEASAVNNLMLTFPSASQAISPNILATSPTNQSPLTTDVMLNAQPLPSINTSPTMLTVEPVSNATIESDIIMNSTISPTMMCTSANGDTMGESSILQAPAQPTSEALLNNFIQPIMKQSDAAVKNLILNAAAEILSSEPNSITTETTNNALMSLNSESSPPSAAQHASPPSITNILTHSDSTSSVVVLAGNNKLIQNGKCRRDWKFRL